MSNGRKFMMKNLEIKYTATHEWIEFLNSTECNIGITERIQEVYSNIIFIELPILGEYEQGEIIGRIETSDGRNFYIYAPISGEVYEINDGLEDDIDKIKLSKHKAKISFVKYQQNTSTVDYKIKVNLKSRKTSYFKNSSYFHFSSISPEDNHS